jgi:hypothetical protein
MAAAIQFPGAMYCGEVLRGDLFREKLFSIEEVAPMEERAVEPERKLPVVKNPVPLCFDPAAAMLKDDSFEHEGVAFRKIWRDPVARTLWLGFKPFMLTSQYFRRHCKSEARDIRLHPERLLQESVLFRMDYLCTFPTVQEYAISRQLVPYLIWALQRERQWPFFKMHVEPLLWTVEKAQ